MLLLFFGFYKYAYHYHRIGNNKWTVFRKKLHTKRTTCIQLYNNSGDSLIKYSLSMYTRLNTSGTVFFLAVFKMMRTKIFQYGGRVQFRGRRTGPRPPFRTRMEIWECHPPLPPSIWRLTGTSICSYVIQSFGRCSCPPFCASLCGSGTRFSPVSRTSSGMWRSRCASVWTGTCWR